MSAPATASDIFQLACKAGLVEPTRLEDYLAGLAGPPPSEPRRAAGMLVRDGLVTYFQAGQLLSGKYRGFVVGPYRILEKLGTGGGGRVFLCEHVAMRRRVALKMLHPTRARDPEGLGRFLREGRAAAALDHPNLVRAFDLGAAGEIYYLAMEYVEGASLHELVTRTGALIAPRAADYAAQAAAGLAFAHGSGLIHRDLKPGNLMVDATGAIKVLDLGLARFENDTTDVLTKNLNTGSVLGTADFVAPEQAIDGHSADARSDIYGLGSTLYYLLAGRPPFPGGTIAQKLIFHQTATPRPLRELCDAPDGLVALVGRMMAKRPADRPESMEEVIDCLAAWRRDRAYPAPPELLPTLSPRARGVKAAAPSNGRVMVAEADLPATVPDEQMVAASRFDIGPPLGRRGLSPREIIALVAAASLAGLLGGILVSWLAP